MVFFRSCFLRGAGQVEVQAAVPPDVLPHRGEQDEVVEALRHGLRGEVRHKAQESPGDLRPDFP